MRLLRDLHWTFPWLAGFLGTLGGWSMKWLRRYLLLEFRTQIWVERVKLLLGHGQWVAGRHAKLRRRRRWRRRSCDGRCSAAAT